MWDDKTYAEVLLKLYNLRKDRYFEMCSNTRKAAKEFNFKHQTIKLINVFQATTGTRGW